MITQRRRPTVRLLEPGDQRRHIHTQYLVCVYVVTVTTGLESTLF
jgi:hypothetical protein